MRWGVVRVGIHGKKGCFRASEKSTESWQQRATDTDGRKNLTLQLFQFSSWGRTDKIWYRESVLVYCHLLGAQPSCNFKVHWRMASHQVLACPDIDSGPMLQSAWLPSLYSSVYIPMYLHPYPYLHMHVYTAYCHFHLTNLLSPIANMLGPSSESNPFLGGEHWVA